MFSTTKFKFAAPLALVFLLACDATDALDPTVPTLAKGGPGSSASNPQWVWSKTSYDFSTNTFAFQTSGVGTNQILAITVSATVSLSYDCQDIDGDGYIPAAFESATETLSTTETYSGNKKGNVSGVISLPLVAQTLSCAEGWIATNIQTEPGSTVLVTVNPAYLPSLSYSN